MRWVFRILLIVSLTICLEVALLWALSYTVATVVSYHGKLYAWSISHPPDVTTYVSSDGFSEPYDSNEMSPTAILTISANSSYGDNMTKRPPRFRALGGVVWSGQLFGKQWDPTGQVALPDVNYWLIAVPHWWVVSASALPSALVVLTAIGRNLFRRRRAAKNHCPSCGYDLRATPDRCPECGAVPAGR